MLKVSNYQAFIAHFQRADDIFKLTVGVIALRFILPTAIKLVAFSDHSGKTFISNNV